MEAIIVPKEQFKDLTEVVNELKSLVAELIKNQFLFPLDNQEFLMRMNLSKRTAQTLRDERTIGYSQVGNKIWYEVADIQAMLKKHHKPAKN